MKKILLSVAVILFTAFYSNAQLFTLSWDGETLGDTTTRVPDSATAIMIDFHTVVNNNKTDTVNIKVVRMQIFMLEGAESEFCWGACYPPTTDSSSQFIAIAPGESCADDKFVAHYKMHGAVGVSLIEYKFYNMDNPDEFVKVVVRFDTSPAAIDENILNNTWVSDIYPNPATNFVNIDHKLPLEVEEASVKIVNILGSVVKEQQVDVGNNKTKMNVSDLNGGIYFYSLFVNGDVYCTKKLIIR